MLKLLKIDGENHRILKKFSLHILGQEFINNLNGLAHLAFSDPRLACGHRVLALIPRQPQKKKHSQFYPETVDKRLYLVRVVVLLTIYRAKTTVSG